MIKKEYHRLIEFGLFHLPVQSGKGVDRQIESFVEIFVSAGCEKISRMVEVECVAWEKMPGYKLIYLFLVKAVQILKFVHRGKPLDVKAVGQQQIGLSAQ